MKNFKLFKRSALLLAVVLLAVVLTVGAIAGAALLSDEGSTEYGEQYAGVQVGTSGKVSLKFYYSTYGTAEEFVAEVIDPETNEIIPQTFKVTDLENTANGYCVPVALAPSQMTHTVKIYANGDAGAGAPIVYSVKEYAEDVIADANLADHHDDMRALLNWGAMAQGYFTDATTALANAGVYARGTNPINAVKEIVADDATVANGTDVTANKYALSLEQNNLAIHFYVNYAGDASQLTATVEREGLAAVKTSVEATGTKGIYRIRVANVNASLFATPYTVKVSAGDDTCTITASVLNNLASLVEANGEEAATAKAMYQFYQNVVDGAVSADCAHGENTYWINNGDETHSYKCAECFKQISNVKVPASATAYYTAFDIDQPDESTNPYQPKSIYLVTTTGNYSGDVEFTRIEGAKEVPEASQLLWQRCFVDVNYTTGTGPQQNYSTDVGSARYLVVKARTNTAGLPVKIAISTTGKNGPTAVADESLEIKESHKNIDGKALKVGDTYVTNVGYKTIVIPTDATKADEWGTYVIDLAAVVPEYYVKEGDSYKVDTFYFHFDKLGVGQTLDVAYMAFVEDGGLSSIVDTAETIEVKGTSGQYKAVDSETGACLHKGVTSSVKIVDGEYRCVCDDCGATIIDYNVPETVDKFSPAILLTNSGTVSGTETTQTYMEEGGVNFIRFTGFTANATGWLGIDPSIKYGNTETGRYLVMRYRTNSAGVSSNAMQILGSTISNNCVGAAITTVRDTSDGAWHTVVIDLSTRVNDPASAFKPEEGTTDTYVLRYLQIRPFSNAQHRITVDAYMDIEYIAVCNELSDVTDIVKEDTYEWSVNGSTNVVKNKNTHVCVSHGYVESRVDNADGTVTFVSACPCGETRYSRTFPASAKVVYDPGSMITQGTGTTDGRLTISTYHQITNKSVEMESFPFFRFYGAADGVTQMLWQRTKANDGGGTQLYKTNVGNSRFMILKLRTNDNTVSWNLKYGTVGAGNSGASYYIPFNSVQSGEWATYVIDLNEVMAAYHKQTDGAYLVDNFYFTSSGLATDEYIDVAYLAFVEGDWSNIDEIVEDTTVIRIADRAKGYSIVDPATGICTGAVHNYVPKTTTNNDGSKTNTIECSVCGKVVATQNIPANINYFADLSTMNYYNNAGTGLNKNMVDFENGIAYNHFYATSSTHWNITGNGSNNFNNAGAYTSAKYSTGEYIVIKYRAGSDADSSMLLFIGTGNVGATNTNASKIGTLSAKANEGWKVAVVKITDAIGDAYVTVDGVKQNKGIGYTVNDEQTLYFMAMPQPGEARQMDIAYFAVVDSLEEVSGLLNDGETYFYHGTSFSNEGNEMTKDGDCITHAIPTAETVNGTVHSVVCSVCGTTLRSYDLETVNWFSPLSGMQCMTANLLTKNLYDSDNYLFYNRYTSTGPCHFLFTGGSSAGTWTTESFSTGNFVVIKYRADATSIIGLYVSTKDHGANTNYTDGRPAWSEIGTLQLRDMAGVGDDGWRVAVIAIPDGIKYTKGSNQQIYIQMTSGSGNTTLDIAYCAVIDTLGEVKGLLGEGENYYYHGTSLKNEPSKFDSNGNCLHTSLSRKDLGTNYQIVCAGCGTVVYDYRIDKSAAAKFQDEFALGHYTNLCSCQTPNVHNGATNSCISKDGNREIGSPQFNRYTINPIVSDPETHVLQGQNLLGGSTVANVNYAVIKFRVGANGLGQNTMYFAFKNDKAETPGINIKVSEDNEWHTVVIDLKSIIRDYTGTYVMGYLRPFGGLTAAEILKNNPDAYVDVAYAAGCNTLADVAKLVGGDTYDWVLADGATEVRQTADLVAE